jgi:two-component system, chemotaxis family, sensor kinase CheA
MNAPLHSRRVILCVDDHQPGLDVRTRLLEEAGYRVVTARNSHQALAIFRENHVDLVLAEHIVPRSMDGPTMAATMKMLKPEVPVAVYSADLEWPEDQFADVFITKLAPVDELLHMIEKLLQPPAAAA